MTHVKRDVKKTNKNLYFVTIQTNKNLIGNEDPIPQENIGDSILNAFKSRPDFIGQVDAETGEQVTFQQMRQNSIKCALWLKKEGVKKGDVITICSRNPSLVYVPFLASIYIGAIANPWEEKYFRDMIRVMYFLVINKPDVVFVDDNNFVSLLSAIVSLKSINKIIKIVIIDKLKSSIKLNSLETILNDDFDQAVIDKFSCEENRMMDSAIRTFSSTTKSYPGQVDIPYIAFTSPSNKETPVMFPNDVGLWYGSLCWTHGSLLTVHSILSYVTAIKSVFSEDNLYKTIEKYKVTWVFLESDMCNQLLNNDYFVLKYDTSSLKTLLFNNWSIHHLIHKELVLMLPDVSVIRVYSKPETGVIAYQRNSDITYRSVGYVAKNVQLAFMGHHFKNEDLNKVNNIFCKTPYITSCNGTEQPWYCTKDRGFYDETGKIFVIADTFKHYIRYKNVILLPEILETMIHRHPAVSEVIVVAVKDPIDFQHPRAYVKIRSGAKVTKEELIEYVERNVHDNCKLRGGVYFITDEFPRLPNGKINRDFLRLFKDRTL